MSENTMKHLEFIQNIVNRMNANSFQIKGWSITITAALLALYASSHNTIYIFIAVVPTLLFWFLDAYYLQQERIFIGIYEDIAGLSNPPVEIREFEMPTHKYKGGKYCYYKAMRSKTIWPVYFLPIIALFIGGMILSGGRCGS
jgi:hypothetical protein